MSDFTLSEKFLAPGLARLLDQRCDQFEAEWKSGRPPRLEDYLGGVTGPDRSLLLGELLAVELAYRARTGNMPGESEYRRRFPGEDECIRNALADFMPPGNSPAVARPVGHATSILAAGEASALLAGRDRQPAQQIKSGLSISPRVDAPNPRPQSGWLRTGALAAAVLIGLAAACGLVWELLRPPSAAAPPPPGNGEPLSGELLLTVSSADGRKSRLRIDEPGAVPVRNGELMHLEARLNQPAFLFVLLLDGDGKVQPLYPWDPAAGFTKLPSVEPRTVLDIPPERERGWVVAGPSGLETVLLLARQAPLPADVDLPSLIGPLPPTPLRDPLEAAWRGFDSGERTNAVDRGRHRGLEPEARQIDEPLLDLMDRLRPHFEMMRAVRYAHQEG